MPPALTLHSDDYYFLTSFFYGTVGSHSPFSASVLSLDMNERLYQENWKMERAMMTKEHRLQRRVEQLVRDLWGVICVKINVQTCNVQNAFERASMPASLIIMGVICVKINVQTCNVQNAFERASMPASLIIMGVICVKINVQTCNVQNAFEHAIVQHHSIIMLYFIIIVMHHCICP